MKKSNLRLFLSAKVKRHLFCALMACATCSIPANAFTQATFISLSKSNVSMHSVMEEIEKLSDYTFFIMITNQIGQKDFCECQECFY